MPSVILLTLLVITAMGGRLADAWVHPGVLNNTAELALLRQQIAASPASPPNPWKAAYDAIPSYLSYVPYPTGSMTVTLTGANFGNPILPMVNDGLACYGSAIRWYVTGNQAHANKAIQILNAWGTHLDGVSGDHADLFISWYSPFLGICAELMKSLPGSGWSAADQTTFRNMANARFVPNTNDITCPHSNSTHSCHNWGALGAWAKMVWGVFLENQPLYNDGMNGAAAIINYYISKFGNAGVFDGFTYETCRVDGNGNGKGTTQGGDLIHAMMAISALSAAAEVSQKQGTLDLYGYLGTDGFGLRHALTGHAPWMYFQRPNSPTPTRPGSNIDTWPCQMTYPGYNGGYLITNPIVYLKFSWHQYFNEYRVPLFQTLAAFRGDASPTRDMLAPWDRLTHNYFGLVEEGPPAPQPTPQTWYVATTGTGTACTQAAPCSIAEVMTKHLGGDTIKLGDGDYPFECNGCLKSGTAGQPTILESLNYGSAIPVGADALSVTPGLATLSGNTGITLWIKPGQQFITVRGVNCTTTGGGSNPCVETSDQDQAASNPTTDIVLENMDIQAPTRTTAIAGLFIRGLAASQRVKVSRVRVHHSGAPVNVAAAPVTHGIRLIGPDHLIEDSDIYSNQGSGIYSLCATCTTARLMLHRNRVMGNGHHGINLANTIDALVSHNISTGNGGAGLIINDASPRVKLFQNTIYQNSLGTSPSYGLYIAVGATGVVRNNILADHPLAPIFIGSQASQVSCSHNLTDAASGSAGCSTWTLNAVPTNVWIDPTHATLASRNFALKTTPAPSVAINNGTPDICASADTTANRCSAALTVSGAAGSLPDQGAIESGFTVPVNQALIAHYSFDTDFTDSTTFANHGTATSVTIDPAIRIGPTGGSALFNAVTDRVAIPLNGVSLSNGLSIAVSARATTLGTLMTIFGHTATPPGFSSRIIVKKDPANRLILGLGGSATAFTSPVTLTANTFYRMVLTLTPGSTAGSGVWAFWLDGVLIGSGTYSGLNQLAPASIGNDDGENDTAWLGHIDELWIWNYPIPASLISTDCNAYCLEPIPPDETFELGAGQIGPSGDNVVSIEVIAGADPAKCSPLSDWQVTYDGVAQTETVCSITGTTPSIARITLAANALPGQAVILTYQALDPITIQNQVQGSGTFDPLVLLSCTTDVTGLDVTCQAQGNPNPNECQGFEQKFVVRDECIPVALSNCSFTTGPGGRFLTLRRVSPPVNAAIAIDFIHVAPDRRLGVTNLFDPDDPEIPPTTDLAQTQWRCRVDGLNDSTPWRGRANTLCRAPSPGGVNLRVAVANTSGVAVPEFATSLFCARQDLDTCSGGSGTCPIGGGGTCTGTCVLGNYSDFTRVSSTFGTLGLRYGPQTAHGVPNGILLPTRALPIDVGLTYAAVGGFRREELQTGRPTLLDMHQMEDEYAIHTGPTAEALPIGTRFICRAHGRVGTALASYTGPPGCTNDAGPFGPGETPCGAPLLITAPERRSR